MTTAMVECEVASGNMFTFQYTNIMDCVAPVCATSNVNEEIVTVMTTTEQMIEMETTASCTFSMAPLDRQSPAVTQVPTSDNGQDDGQQGGEDEEERSQVSGRRISRSIRARRVIAQQAPSRGVNG